MAASGGAFSGVDGSGSRPILDDFYDWALPAFNSFKDINKTVQKICTLVKNVWTLEGHTIPILFKKAFKGIKILRVIELPEVFGKFLKVRSFFDLVNAISGLYFALYDLREGMEAYIPFKLIPAIELPLTAVMGLGTIPLFGKAIYDYYQSSQEECLVGFTSLEESWARAERHNNCKKEIIRSGLKMVESLSIGATLILPWTAPLMTLYAAAKAIGCGYWLFEKHISPLI